MLRTARWVTGSAFRDLVLFALVWSWMVQLLLPFGEATKIPSISPFLLYLGVLFAVDFLIGNFLGRVALKLILLGTFMFYNYFTQYSFFDPMWLAHWVTDLYFSSSLVLRSHLELLPDSVYTTVFLIVLWLLQSFFRQSLRSRAWMVVFLILGSVGLGVLDTFYVEDDKTQIVLFVLIGLIILAFIQLPVIERIARMPQRMKGWPREWLAWTLVLSLIVVGTSWAAPKKTEASWPDPVAYLNSKVGKGTGPVYQKIGYGSDDAHLGGPFEMDNTEVFTVLTDNESYYQGETKTVYTGNGWLSTSLGQPITNLKDITQLQQHDMIGSETKKVVQTYSFQIDMQPIVFNEYRLTGVDGVFNDAMNVHYSDLDNRLTIGQLKAGTSYTVTSQVPIYDEKKLKVANVPETSAGFAVYTQLPTELPQRVRDLAVQIVQGANAKTPYERAQALESYLRNKYTYDTKDVPHPTEGQDFVDQFLFDSKRGYCDHFSSAFVVMARSLNMPTRWVKGFTIGDVDMSYHSGQKDVYKYVVRNRNAHSWPEVYFEGVGWVPFEPTATFQSAPRLMKKDEDTSTIAPPIPGIDKKKNKPEETQDSPTHSTSSTFDINWKAVGTSAAILAGIALVLAFIFRRTLLTWYYIRRSYKGDEDAVTALNRLFMIMAKLGWHRTNDMTLREYASHLSSSVVLRGREMIPLTKLFERVRYGQQEVSDKEKLQIRDLWTRMIRKAGRFKGK